MSSQEARNRRSAMSRIMDRRRQEVMVHVHDLLGRELTDEDAQDILDDLRVVLMDMALTQSTIIAIRDEIVNQTRADLARRNNPNSRGDE